jgi:hypothetical protein
MFTCWGLERSSVTLNLGYPHIPPQHKYPHYQIPPLGEYRLQLQKLKKTEPELFKHAVVLT